MAPHGTWVHWATLLGVLLFGCAMDGGSAAAGSGGGGTLRMLGPALSTVFFVGDTHGDAACCREWVRRTGLVDLEQQPWAWVGAADTAMVLLGDYVDKGPQSRGVLEFVRELEQAFPTNVVAMMGNHDLFALLDATLVGTADRPMGGPVAEYTFAFPHPQEYVEAGWSPPRADDAELLAALLGGLQSVYSQHAQRSVRMPVRLARSELYREKGWSDLFDSRFPPFRNDAALAGRVRSRVALWQDEYAAGLVDSGLAAWLRGRPLVAIVGDALVATPLPPLQTSLFAPELQWQSRGKWRISQGFGTGGARWRAADTAATCGRARRSPGGEVPPLRYRVTVIHCDTHTKCMRAHSGYPNDTGC
jgi:hypothetical protein